MEITKAYNVPIINNLNRLVFNPTDFSSTKGGAKKKRKTKVKKSKLSKKGNKSRFNNRTKKRK